MLESFGSTGTHIRQSLRNDLCNENGRAGIQGSAPECFSACSCSPLNKLCSCESPHKERVVILLLLWWKASDYTCKFKNTTCHYCHKQDHIATVCHNKIWDAKRNKIPLAKPTHYLQAEDNTQASEYVMYCTPSSHTYPNLVTVALNDADHTMEVDTGARLLVMSGATYQSLWSPPKKQ